MATAAGGFYLRGVTITSLPAKKKPRIPKDGGEVVRNSSGATETGNPGGKGDRQCHESMRDGEDRHMIPKSDPRAVNAGKIGSDQPRQVQPRHQNDDQRRSAKGILYQVNILP